MTEKEKRRFTQAKFREALTILMGVFSKGEEPENQFVRDLFSESERGCVLVASAYIDRALASLLASYFARESDIKRKEVAAMFDFGVNPFPLLGSFASKVIIAHATGLIDKRLRIPLDRIRQVRNKFAHYPGRISIGAFPMPSYAHFDSDPPFSLSAIIDSMANLAGAVRVPKLSKDRVHFMLTSGVTHGLLRAIDDAVKRGERSSRPQSQSSD